MINYDQVKNLETLADNRCPATILMEKEEGIPVPDHNGFSAGSLMKLANFAATHPHKWRTALAKIKNPFASYAELAEELGTTKQTICRHLKTAKEEIPEIRSALIIDTRYQNHNRKGAA